MRDALFGYTGFVGGWILRNNHDIDAHLYNTKNIYDAVGKTFKTVYFAAAPAVKWKANKEPEEDLRVINDLIDIINQINVTDRFVLISTVDVYANAEGKETDDFDDSKIACHAYGKHRKMLESMVMKRFGKKTTIIRLPALFGDGLKKNVLYDLLHNNDVHKIKTDTYFQWYNLEWLGNDMRVAIEKELLAVNFVPEAIKTETLIRQFFPEKLTKVNTSEPSGVRYNISSVFSKDFHHTTSDVIDTMRKFIEREKNKRFKTKLGVSVIILPHTNNLLYFMGLLKIFSIDYCEMAPTMLTNGKWTKLTHERLISSSQQFPIYSLQSVTYGLEHLNIFLSPDETLSHFTTLIKSASESNVSCLVFGCPKTRYIPVNFQNHHEVAIQFFRSLGDLCEQIDNRICICLENNSSKYGCNFLNIPSEVSSFVRSINHSRIRMMIDIGNALMEGKSAEDVCDSISKNQDILQHIHISEPFMQSPSTERRPLYDKIRSELERIEYSKGVTLEVASKKCSDLIATIEFFSSCFR